jgi:hypothetical protein
VAILAGAELQRRPRNEPLPGNRLASLLSSAAAGLGEGFITASIVVAVYVSLLTDDLIVIGSIPALAYALWNVGALLGATLVGRSSRRTPWALAFHLVRTGMIGLASYVAFQDDAATDDRLRAFLFAYAVFGLTSGAASEATQQLMRSSIPAERRARLLTHRALLGPALAIAAGVVTRQVFAQGSLSPDRAFAYLFLAATAAMATSTFFIVIVRESVGIFPPPSGATFGTSAHRRSVHAFRRYVLVRALIGGAAMADVFLVIYAIREFQLPLEHLGAAATVLAGAALLTTFATQSLRLGISPRGTLQFGAVMKLVPPLIALALPYIASSEVFTDRASSNALLHWLIVASFAPIGFAIGAAASGGFGYLSALSSAHMPSFRAQTNVVLALAALLPMLGGWVIETWSFRALFAVALGIAVIALLGSGLLPATAMSHEAPRSSPGTSRFLRQHRIAIH